MDKATGKLALKILGEIKEHERKYRESREAWFRNGDGRSPKWYQGPDDDRPYNYGGKGYAYPACIHGKSNWTDYDNICGGCEDSSSIYEIAIGEAHSRMAKANERRDWFLTAPDSLRHTDMWRDLLDWVLEPLR